MSEKISGLRIDYFKSQGAQEFHASIQDEAGNNICWISAETLMDVKKDVFKKLIDLFTEEFKK